MGVTPADEWMCHQTVSTFDHVDTSDLQWTERVWVAAFEKSGRFQVAFGMGKYTNRNVLDASISITVDNRTQYNVRASRALFPEVETYKVGPLGYEIPEPLKCVRIFCDDNEYGIACDLCFIGGTEVYEQTPSMFRRRNGRLVNHMLRYFQAGTIEGWLEVDGVRHEVHQEQWWAARDRSWGLRSNSGESTSADGISTNLLGGLEPPGKGVAYRWSFFTMQFPTWDAAFEFAQTPAGARLGPALGHVQFGGPNGHRHQKIVNVDHDWDFVPGSQRVLAIHSVIHLDDGTTKDVRMEPVSVCYRRPGGGHYGGWKGWVQGIWQGTLRIDGDKIDLVDPAFLDSLHFSDDYAVKLTCGDETGWGIAEPLIPGISELLTT